MNLCLRTAWGLLLGTLGCGGPELHAFDVTIKTVRNCHPAGLIPFLCDDPGTFATKTRSARLVVEVRGQDFIVYDEQGRALAGNIERGNHYFARSNTTTTTPDACQKSTETNLKFSMHKDFLPTLPKLHTHRVLHFDGNRQERASQNEKCGQATSSRLEEDLVGDEVDVPSAWPPAVPKLPGAP